MRTTQFIGLTDKAKQIVAGLEEKTSSRTCYGMFEEDIPLREWVVQGKTSFDDVIKEIVQLIPWSSGPVILTCLETKGRKLTESLWREDRTSKYEVDVKLGTYWI